MVYILNIRPNLRCIYMYMALLLIFLGDKVLVLCFTALQGKNKIFSRGNVTCCHSSYANFMILISTFILSRLMGLLTVTLMSSLQISLNTA